MIEYTAADLERFAPNDEVLPKVLDAEMRGDEAAACELRRQMIYPAESLLMIRDVLGAEWLRKQGWDTSEAERMWGKAWMDRHDI